MSKLTKADSYLYSDILTIVDEGYKDINPRPKYEDGTPAYTYSVNHRVRTYDLADGQFPICTLRRQAWKTGIKEILVIYQKQFNIFKPDALVNYIFYGVFKKFLRVINWNNYTYFIFLHLLILLI